MATGGVQCVRVGLNWIFIDSPFRLSAAVLDTDSVANMFRSRFWHSQVLLANLEPNLQINCGLTFLLDALCLYPGQSGQRSSSSGRGGERSKSSTDLPLHKHWELLG